MAFEYKTKDSLLKVKFKVIYRRVDHPIADTNNIYISPIMRVTNKNILAASSYPVQGYIAMRHNFKLYFYSG